MFARIFLNSWKERPKDEKTEFFLCDVEGLTFNKRKIHTVIKQREKKSNKMIIALILRIVN